MFLLHLIPILILSPQIHPFSQPHRHLASPNLRKKLDAEAENAVCCKNNLPCCRKPEKPTNFEVKAIVTDCPNTQCTNFSSQIVINSKKPVQEKLTNCHQKLLLTVNMISEGIPNDKSQYIIIDHIVDAVTSKKVRILNPYAVRIRQQPLLQVYNLHFERAVNAEAREVVHNKDTPNFEGCSQANPTCRAVKHEGRAVPYSEGFCCSCDPDKDAVRGQWPERVPEYRKNRPGGDDAHYKHYGFSDGDGKMVYGRGPKRADQSVNYRQFKNSKDGKTRQRRGGQSCDDVDLSSIPQSFHQSAHCLTFSNLWYSVYGLEKPQIVQKLRIQIFQKYEDCHGNTHWMDLTQGKVVEIGTHERELVDKTIIARYNCEKVDEADLDLDYQTIKLLVPEKRVVNPDQFMVLPKKLISEDGSTCDTAGVGYEGFYKQKKRCAQPPGSCLNNQPQQLFDSDKKAEEEGRAGKYFLKFYGILADNPVAYNSSGHLRYLKMIYTKKHVSNLYFELNADLVTLLKPNSFATITEIYTDATNPQRTRIVVKVTNSGLLYGVFYVRLSNCPLEIPASFNNIASKSVLILAQHQHIFNLYIEYPLPVDEFYCSIHVHNINQELLAVRAVRIQTYDRCICIWHCECACYVTDRGLKCNPMTLEAYHQAGFQGGFPFATKLIESSYLDEMLALLLDMFTFLIITLLIMGLIKALLGLVCKPIGLWGLDAILGTDEKKTTDIICDNEQCEAKQQQNEDGISTATQFCLNLIFFFIFPLVLCNVAINKFCFPKYTDEGGNNEEKWDEYGECDEECLDECEAVCHQRNPSDGDSCFSMQYTTSEDKASMTSQHSVTSRQSRQSLRSRQSRQSLRSRQSSQSLRSRQSERSRQSRQSVTSPQSRLTSPRSSRLSNL